MWFCLVTIEVMGKGWQVIEEHLQVTDRRAKGTEKLYTRLMFMRMWGITLRLTLQSQCFSHLREEAEMVVEWEAGEPSGREERNKEKERREYSTVEAEYRDMHGPWQLQQTTHQSHEEIGHHYITTSLHYTTVDGL